jgi:hypothetical protein
MIQGELSDLPLQQDNVCHLRDMDINRRTVEDDIGADI